MGSGKNAKKHCIAADTRRLFQLQKETVYLAGTSLRISLPGIQYPGQITSDKGGYKPVCTSDRNVQNTGQLMGCNIFRTNNLQCRN